jgi:hypothetical protein
MGGCAPIQRRRLFACRSLLSQSFGQLPRLSFTGQPFLLLLLSPGLLGLAHALMRRVGLALALGRPALLVVAAHRSMSIC